MKKTITVQAPFAYPKDRVLVDNYRSKKKDGSKTWEEGVVNTMKLDFRTYGTYWGYTVLLNRKSRSGMPVYITVGDGSIQKL